MKVKNWDGWEPEWLKLVDHYQGAPAAPGVYIICADREIARAVGSDENTYKTGKKRWEVTPDGKDYAVITDTGKNHSDGKPVQQILWKESVAKPLKRLAEKLQAEMPEVVAHGLSR